MSHEKRLVLFFLASTALMLSMSFVQERLAPPKPVPPVEIPIPPPDPAEAGDPKGKIGFIDGVDDVFAPPAAAEAPPGPRIAGATGKVEPVAPEELVIGSVEDRSGRGYRLRVQLDQQGAGVDSILSSRFETEWIGRVNPHRPMPFIERDPRVPPSFVMDLVPPDELEEAENDNAQARAEKAAARARYALDGIAWDVERDKAGRIVREAPPRAPGGPAGQEVRFRTSGGDGLSITKVYRLYPGEEALELALEIASPGGPRTATYKLLGPHGLPIEGEWYTSTFRDVCIGQVKGNGSLDITSLTGYDVAKKDKENERLTERPLRFAGVETQYFAVLLEPEKEGEVAATVPVLILDNPANRQKADVSVEVTSRPAEVGPGHPVSHGYKIFAGPKTVAALRPFGAEELVSYRKGWQLPVVGPIATMLARHVIAPMLDRIHALTAQVGGSRGGSYGIAIILLTVFVRLMLFPLGRKTALNAQKMQALQPQLAELREKYKGENEKLLKEQQALYRRNGVNMFGGCLPALIQLPIFIGLWQALNNSVSLRHAHFLWIQNLAAPDMLFRFPGTVPFLGDYFNLLPFVVVGLMLVQNKLFMPPASTPEAEMQQSMMKYMMIFMAFMFYKVPSGLGIYFITSSTWAICERLLLPKVVHAPAPAVTDEDLDGKGGNDKGPAGGPGNANGGGGGWLSKKLEALLEEAARERTIRNAEPDRRGPSPQPDRGKGPDRPRPRPGKRK